MKVLHVTPAYVPAYIYGGAVTAVEGLVKAQKLVAEVRILTTLANGRAELELPAGQIFEVNGVSVLYCKRLTGDHSHFSPQLLWSFIKTARHSDIIHIHSWWNLVAMLVALICTVTGKSFILSPHGMLGSFTFQSAPKRLFHRALGRFLLKKAVFHATSVQEKGDIEQRVPGARVFVMPNIIVLPEPSSPFPKGESPFPIQLLFLSRIHPKKGLDLLFQALSRVNFPWHLSIAGEGEARYVKTLQELALELGMASQISWLGWQSGSEKEQLLQQSDLLVLTSRHENFANVVVEVLALGTPVLVSDQVGLSDYVQMHGLGRVCSLDPEDIAAKLADLQADIESRAHIRNTAPDLIRRDFDPQMLAQKYVETYKHYFFD